MDPVIARLPAQPDGDLTLCPDHGVAYQTDMGYRNPVAYHAKCSGYAGSRIAIELNRGRLALVRRHVADDVPLLDVGIGSGEFITWRGANTFGFDVDDDAIQWLRTRGLYRDDLGQFRVFTYWDVIEHIENPQSHLTKMWAGSWLFCCVPIFSDLHSIRESRHYRPGEHLYYWTEAGFRWWVAQHGFSVSEVSNHETAAGRNSVLAFALKRT